MANVYYRASVEAFSSRLEGVNHFLGKGVEFAVARGMKDENFFGARLHADMLPLVSQIRIATDHAKGGAGRIAGVELPVFEDDETTIADLKGRVGKALSFLETLSPEQFEGVEERRVSVKLGPDTREFSAPAYLFHFALPNFYFHIATAYGILRAMGVEVGKRDFFGQNLIQE